MSFNKANEMIESWDKLFNPKSIAVVGASNTVGKWGFIIPMNLVVGGYEGELYMINSKEKSIHGLPTYKSLSAIGKPVDLVMVMVPAKFVGDVLDEVHSIGTKNVVVISSGFSEVSEEGRQHEKELAKKAWEYGIRLIGPNTMGICSAPTNLFALGSFTRPPAGHISFVSQSGNLGVQLLGWAMRSGLGISRFVGSGNEAVITCDQILEYYGCDPLTQVIIMYIEGIDNGTRFLEVARHITPHKPIIALKVGATEEGARAASSHSGAVSTQHRVYQAMVKQAGIIEAHSTEEMVNLARTFGNLPIPKGRRVGIMTMGGGWGVVTTDACSRAGLKLPQPAEQTLDDIDQVLPAFWSHGNPVDLVGTMDRKAHTRVLEALVRDPNYDAIVTLGSLTGMQYASVSENFTRVKNAIIEIWKRHKWNIGGFIGSVSKGVRESMKPKKSIRKTGENKAKSGGLNLRQAKQWSDEAYSKQVRRLMRASGKPIIPVPFDPSTIADIFKHLELVAFGIPEGAVNALSKLADYNDFLERHKAEQARVDRDIPNDDTAIALTMMLKNRSGALTEKESKNILTHYGIAVTNDIFAADEKEALAAAAEIGYPVVVKVDSPDIAHKSDAGCVVVGVNDDEELKEAFTAVTENAKKYKRGAKVNGVTVQEMIEGGTEVLVGVSTDPIFGQTIVFGLGGVFVEVLEDVSIRILPIELVDAERMVDEIKGRKILEGARGQKPRDIKSLAETIWRVADMVGDFKGRITELDINPLVVFENGKGVKALDALIILNEEQD
jgi:acetate---CoA ligase (ADP-forming)